MKKVFLGGTCSDSLWRDNFVKGLKLHYFNPAGDEWTEEMQEEEIKQREESDFCLYVLTPKMAGYYSIAEVIEDSIKKPDKTIFSYLIVDGKDSFTQAQIKSLEQVAEMVKRNGAKYFKKLSEVIEYLNSQ
jgi:hypothetical protein